MKDEADLFKGAEVYHQNERNGAPLLKVANGAAAKLFRRKGYVQHLLRVLSKSTKAHKQWEAAQTLISIGLKTPKPLSVVVFDGRGDYEASFKYQFLENARPMHNALEETEDRLGLLAKLAKELAAMYQAGVLFIDFHLGNVLVDDNGELFWIDPELTSNKQKVVKQFWLRMERMHRKCDPGVLSEDEWEFFCQQIRERI